MVTGVREIVAVDISTIGMRDGFWKDKERKMNNGKQHRISFLRYVFKSAALISESDLEFPKKKTPTDTELNILYSFQEMGDIGQ